MTIELQTPVTLMLESEVTGITDSTTYLLTMDVGGGIIREIDAEQSWFWTREWQAREAEADADLAAGRYDDFDDIDSFIASL